jgi:hypothetical protein
MLSSSKLLEEFGFGTIEHQVAGDREQTPADLRSLLPGIYKS